MQGCFSKDVVLYGSHSVFLGGTMITSVPFVSRALTPKCRRRQGTTGSDNSIPRRPTCSSAVAGRAAEAHGLAPSHPHPNP